LCSYIEKSGEVCKEAPKINCALWGTLSRREMFWLKDRKFCVRIM